jgi:cobalt-zinc-cadmium efflux system membrane fusion protein
MNNRFPATYAFRVLLRLVFGIALLALLAPPLHADDEGDEDSPSGEESEEEGRTFSVEEFERSGVTLATAAPGEVDVGIDLPGEVRPNPDRLAHIAPRFPGVVREVRKHIGDSVKGGDVLAIIESENLSPFELRTAFDGTIIDKNIAPGEAVTREKAAFIVADLSTVWVTVSVYQDMLALVRVGQPVSIRASSGGDHTEGRISYVSPVVDQATRTALARVVLSNATGIWRPGLFVTVTIHDPVQAPVVVSRRAVQSVEGKPTVFVVEGERFEPRAVSLGQVGRTTLAVTSGLEPGDRYADERSFLVKAELGKGEAGDED